MKRKTLKPDSINQLLSPEKRKIEQIEKNAWKQKDMWRTWERWRLSFPYESIVSSWWCPQKEEAWYQNTFATSSDGQGYDSSSAKSHFIRIIRSLPIISYNSLTERNANESKPSIVFINGLSPRAFIVCTDNTYQFSAVCESVFQQY